MPRRKTQFHEGGIYHIYNRGIHQKDIFKDDQDKGRFLRKLRELKEKFKMTILAYCIMTNHFHLEIRQDKDIPISDFMRSLMGSSAMYFNKKYGGSGHLFESPFQCKEVLKEEYLIYLSCYIHLNPIEIGYSTQNLHEYQWSSYPDYLGLRKGTLADKDIVMSYFRSKNRSEAYKKSAEEINYYNLEKQLDIAGLIG